MKAITAILMMVWCFTATFAGDIFTEMNKMSRDGIQSSSSTIQKYLKKKGSGVYNQPAFRNEINRIVKKLSAKITKLKAQSKAAKPSDYAKRARIRNEIKALKKQISSTQGALHKISDIINKMDKKEAKKIDRGYSKAVNKIKQSKVGSSTRTQLGF